MDIKPIIVREYLESLTENAELDYIFPILLESQGFIILSKPKEYKGLPQYGKDIVAVGEDFEDGITKRFYFELKGGEDRHITDANFTKRDGILESLRESKYKDFTFSNQSHLELPLKIVLVHNGEIKSNVKETFDGFISKEFPKNGNIEFDRWGISELTKFFSERLFGAFLLTDSISTKLFNKVLINLDASEKVSENFTDLLDRLFGQIERNQYSKNVPRKWTVLFESLRLIAFVVYTESKSYNNLSIAKKYTTCLVIRFWHWILKNQIENDKTITQYFDKILDLYFYVISEYFERTLPIVFLEDGLFAERGGRYEQIGYTCRTFNYLQDLCLYFSFVNPATQEESIKEIIKQKLILIINANPVSNRPLLDIHSMPIIDILVLLINLKDIKNAKGYLSGIVDNLIHAKEKYDRLPDANNDINNVIKLVLTHEKTIYYSDSTSLLLEVLMEFIVILDMNELYCTLRDFICKHKIDIAVFVPHHGINSKSKHLIEDKDNDLEELLFSRVFFNEGYQHCILLTKELSYKDFKSMITKLKEEFTYEYRTDKAGYSFLRTLAHIYNQTPYFPDKWRYYLE